MGRDRKEGERGTASVRTRGGVSFVLAHTSALPQFLVISLARSIYAYLVYAAETPQTRIMRTYVCIVHAANSPAIMQFLVYPDLRM